MRADYLVMWTFCCMQGIWKNQPSISNHGLGNLRLSARAHLSEDWRPSVQAGKMRRPLAARSCMKFNMFRFPAAGGRTGGRAAEVGLGFLLLLRDCRHCPRVGSVTRVIRSVRKEKERAPSGRAMMTPTTKTETTTAIPHA